VDADVFPLAVTFSAMLAFDAFVGEEVVFESFLALALSAVSSARAAGTRQKAKKLMAQILNTAFIGTSSVCPHRHN
jgi:hypothetical protein